MSTLDIRPWEETTWLMVLNPSPPLTKALFLSLACAWLPCLSEEILTKDAHVIETA